ncbi:MAG: 4-alpha-glucanotransferase [Oscillospiraceae bacterium]|nr:4-alpha-glucanotransferase [Oscillospiraceae bacterium]
MRSAGVVLPIFSLPGNEGIGTLGEDAYNFIDFLFDSKLQYWQVPPVCHSKNNSPYSSYCVFSGNYNLIDIKKLVFDGLLDKKSYKKYLKLFKYESVKINYKKINIFKLEILKTCFNQSFDKLKNKIEKFRKSNSYWIENYALYIALKKYVFEDKPWQQWDEYIKTKNKTSIDIYKEQLKDKIDFIIFLQYLFYSQWFELKNYANSKNIKLIGEMPLYCDLDSCDVWAHQNLFKLNKNFESEEKLYHDQEKIYNKYCLKNKITYNINNLKKSHYRFLIQEIAFLNNIYDEVSINNFDQYDKYKIIDNNKYLEKPGIKDELFKIAKSLVPNFRYFLHDIDFSNKLLNTYDIPVSKTMTDGFLSEKFSVCLPHNYNISDIVYISDSVFESLQRWKKSLPGLKKRYCNQYINNVYKKSFNYDFIAKAYHSTAEKILIPIQDILGLDSKGVLLNNKKNNNNWSFRLSNKPFDKKVYKQLNDFSVLYER